MSAFSMVAFGFPVRPRPPRNLPSGLSLLVASSRLFPFVLCLLAGGYLIVAAH